jgi:choline-sulfatase
MRILYVDCDTLRPDHLGCYGYHRSTAPTVDALAAEGVRFTRCYASDVPCLPSRTALFSGRFGARTGVVGHAGSPARMRYPGDGHSTDPKRAPLPLVLSQAGYHTATFSTFHQRHLAWHFCAGWREIQRFTDKIGDEIATDLEGPAIEWLRRKGRDDNWFLHLHFWDPHTIYDTPESFGDPFADDEAGGFPSEEAITKAQESYGPLGARDLISLLPQSPRHPAALASRADLKTWIDGYDTGIRYFDETLGRIVDSLAGLGILDETAIVVSSDHGENQGELNLYGAHLTADHPTCHIPLVIRWPGKGAGLVRDELLYQLDLGPTLCELLGVPAPEGWDGRSFAPALAGEPVEAPRTELILGQGAWFVQRAVLTDTDELYVRTMHQALDPMPKRLLFDLRRDPHQEHDLADLQPDRAAQLDARLSEWWHELAPAVGRDPLLEVCRLGGGPYARPYRQRYLAVLRETGREWAAREIESRHIGLVPDPFDFDRF